jgi:hypothetical protein
MRKSTFSNIKRKYDYLSTLILQKILYNKINKINFIKKRKSKNSFIKSRKSKNKLKKI